MALHVTHVTSYKEEQGSVWPCKRYPGWSGACLGRNGSALLLGVGACLAGRWFGAVATWPLSLLWGVPALGIKVRNRHAHPGSWNELSWGSFVLAFL